MRSLGHGDARGFSMAELMVVVAVVGIIAVLGLPTFITYWRTATLRAGSEELATVLNNARQLAISSNNTVCVSTSGTTAVQYHVGTCGSAVYIGQGTSSTGAVTFASAVQIMNNPQVTFTYLGGASQAGVYTVQNPVNGSVQTVTVTTSGRITIP